ncbi:MULTISPECIES: hypothetical protein [Streptomyces]|uniref:Uncharacterized protein n=1 Tax=Streptomyces broussonetiae TaxID=2686304 RepID=A0ABV5EEN0_9ACTN|nr:hypothetical protein [Streptomyces sp. B93]MBQ1087894.1 hypothetical protein [Streptomyces sp. B93]
MNDLSDDPRDPAAAPGRPGPLTVVLRNPWKAVCAAATVVLGPAAVTASALDQANAAPLHETYETWLSP